MITYPIKTAQTSGIFDETFVSTEDEEIKKIALSAGAHVIDRPVELSQDRSTVVQVCMHVIEKLSDRL